MFDPGSVAISRHYRSALHVVAALTRLLPCTYCEHHTPLLLQQERYAELYDVVHSPLSNTGELLVDVANLYWCRHSQREVKVQADYRYLQGNKYQTVMWVTTADCTTGGTLTNSSIHTNAA